MISTAPLLETSLAGLTLHRPRQGPRRLRFRRRPPADRRHRSHLGVRLRARLRHSRQGQGAHAAVGVLVRAHRRPRAASPDLDRRRRAFPRRSQPHADVAARPVDAGAAHASRCRSNASRAAICRARAGRTISRPAASAASRCRQACASRIACPSRSSRRRPRPRAATTINISEDEAAQIVGRPLVDRG